MTIGQQHPMILRLLGLAMFAFGVAVLGFPAFGELAEGTLWKVIAVTTPVGLLFTGAGVYALLGRFEVEIDLRRGWIIERRSIGPLRWTRWHPADTFDRVTITQREIRDSSHAMTYYQLHLRGRRAKASILLDSDKDYGRIRSLAVRVVQAMRLDLYDRNAATPAIVGADLAARPLRDRLREGEADVDDPARGQSGESDAAPTAEDGFVLPRRLPTWDRWLAIGLMSLLWFLVVGVLLQRLLTWLDGSARITAATIFGIVFIIVPLLVLAVGLLKVMTMREHLDVNASRLRLERRWLLGSRRREIPAAELMELDVADEECLIACGLHEAFTFGHGLPPEQLGQLRRRIRRRLAG